MPPILKFPSRHPIPAGRRLVVGLMVGSRCRRVDAALVAAEGTGLGASAQVVALHHVNLAPEIAEGFRGLDSGESAPVIALARLRAALAECQAAAVGELLAAAGIAPGRVLALGVHDPGLWPSGAGNHTEYLGLCEPALLAEATGLSVVDAFPARDLAQRGQGGPVTPLAEWVLLRDQTATRCLLNLGRTFRLTFLPAEAQDPKAGSLQSFDVGPGMRMLDLLTQRLTRGQEHFDPGGRLAVQGKRIAELVEHWLSDPYFDRPVPRWHARGVPPERFLGDALEMALQRDWSIRDLLCSATHFLAETVALALRKRPLAHVRVDQLLVSGGGQHNGLLLREIGRLTGLPLLRVDQLDVASTALEPAVVGLLALLHLDQVPANRPEITGAEVPRLLGRLTPGHPQNWRRLLQCCAGQRPAARPLRSAL